MTCIFCHGGEIEACVCSNCSQVILASPREKIEKAITLAVEKSQVENADYLKKYLEGGLEDEPKNRKFIDRRGSGRTLRTKQKRDWGFKTRSWASISEDQSNQTAVPGG